MFPMGAMNEPFLKEAPLRSGEAGGNVRRYPGCLVGRCVEQVRKACGDIRVLAETVNCGCQSLPWMESWEVKHPGRNVLLTTSTPLDFWDQPGSGGIGALF